MQNKILVIGDTILDEYIYIDPKKVSDEAHVITSNIVDKKYVLGGAANVARNVSTLGGICTYIGLSSKQVAHHLKTCMQEYDLKHMLFETNNSVQIKTRVISTRGAQVSRFDSIFEQKCDNSIKAKILDYLEKNIKHFDFLIISKYYDFFLSEEFINQIIKIVQKAKVQIIVDNRQANIDYFANADFYKMNFNEFCNVYNCQGLSNNLETIMHQINIHGMSVNCLLITRSSLPTIICLKADDKIIYNEVIVEEVKVRDVSGAGDTFVAAFATNFINCDNNLESITKVVKICHNVCNVVVKKMGTNVVWTYEFSNDVPLNLLCDQLKKNGNKIVFTNGVFDILHIGHIKLLKEAKALGDYLIIGLNSDKSVKRLKGPMRPINCEQDREIILEGMRFVDHVIIFDDDTVSKLLEQIKPDVYVKGGDYTIDTLPEKDALKFVGKVHFVKITDGKSSTDTINRIREK